MAAPKAKTLQERFGFLDPDLKKPQHDAIIKWLDRNIEDILQFVFQLAIRTSGVKTKWEQVIHQTGSGGQIIGFVDFMATHHHERILFEVKTEMPTLGELFR